MARQKLFVSFDFDNDATLKMLFVNQSKHPDAPFDIWDSSVKEHMLGDWQAKVKARMMAEQKIDQSLLWNDVKPGDDYPAHDKWHDHLLEQYKLYVEMADRISQRRVTANNYFLTVNSAILGFVGYLTSKDSTEYLWLLAIGGCTLTFLWYSIVVSHKQLNTAKWLVVHEIEKRLPIRPYDAEWAAVEHGKNPKLYWPMSHIEAAVPWVFFALHIVVIWRAIPWVSALHAVVGTGR